ncbi:MAG: acyl-CoA dehydrogenase, partial [Rhodococcus sp.]|nr:acyl-CoA dehydrogenase [Rhodococcus sp. (in: high G+C Gram-positive bacteria)]
MGHYKSNVRDLEFNLFELLGIDKVLETGAYGDLDADTVREMLSEIRRLAEGPLAESFADADRNPPVFDPETHSVTLPDSFKKSYKALEDGEWAKVGVSEELGGLAAPSSVTWALNEMVLGSNPAAQMYAAGAGFAQVLYNNGTDEQKKWAAAISERNWGATMVLTEPDA